MPPTPEPGSPDEIVDVWYWPAKGVWRPTVPGNAGMKRKAAEGYASLLRSLGNHVEIRPTTKPKRR